MFIFFFFFSAALNKNVLMYLIFLSFLTSHGNNCAGVIAAVANNLYCGVGIAYSANISGN